MHEAGSCPPAGYADERGELRLALADHAPERLLAQKRQLLIAADELRAAYALDADACTRGQRFHTGMQLGLSTSPPPEPASAVVNGPLGRAVRRVVDEDGVRRRRRLAGARLC